MNEAIRMQLSAFVDGELPENEAELLLRRLSQDAVLRQQVAEFMAIGRAMRGEVQVSGIDSLRDRVAESLDAVPAIDDAIDELPVENRMVRPLAGFAIAATVAIAAIFGLGQISGGGVDVQDSQIAGSDEPAGYTQAPPEDIFEDELLREMRRRHDAVASDQRIGTRLTTVVVPREIEDEDDVADELLEIDTAEDATVE
jgi:negative regulator of sigma E activity